MFFPNVVESLSQLSIKTRIETGFGKQTETDPERLSQLSIKTRIETADEPDTDETIRIGLSQLSIKTRIETGSRKHKQCQV